jgi:hypothetical protein
MHYMGRVRVAIGLCVLAVSGVAMAQAAAPSAATTAAVATTQPKAGYWATDLPIANPVHAPRSMKRLKAAPLYSFSEAEVGVYLKQLQQDEPDPVKRVVHLARKNIGQPYEIYLLGEFPYEMYDPDPMYCLTKSDCVTHVEHVYAMALSRDWPSFFKTLQRIRYKDGKIGLVTRNNESVADWTPNNAWLFDDITAKLAASGAAPMHLVWQPSKFYGQFGLGQGMPDVTIDTVYIPSEKVESIQSQLKEGDIVHIVRGTPGKSQWVGHFGMVVFGEGGKVNMLHSAEPAVREQGLMDFVEKNKNTIGLRILRPKTEMQQIVDREVGAGAVTPTVSAK